MASRRPAVPAQAARAAAAAVKGSTLGKRGRHSWVVEGIDAISGVSMEARYADDELIVTPHAFAIPTWLPRLLPDSVGDGRNANGVAWSVDPWDFGGPDGYPAEGPAAVVGLQQLQDMVHDHLLPAAEEMQHRGRLLDFVHQQVTTEGFPTPFTPLQYVALALTRHDAAAAAAAVRRYVQQETEDLAQFTSKPWRMPFDMHADLTILEAAFPQVERPLAEVLQSLPVADLWVWLGREPVEKPTLSPEQ